MPWNSLDTFFNFPLLLTLVAFLNKFFNIALDTAPEKSIWNLCIFESLLQCEDIGLAFDRPNPLWTSLIIACCRSMEEITSLVLLHINCQWSIEKSLQAFQKLAFLPSSHIMYDGLMFLSTYVLIASKLTWRRHLANSENTKIYLQKWKFFQNNMLENVQTFENTMVSLWNNFLSRGSHSDLVYK